MPLYASVYGGRKRIAMENTSNGRVSIRTFNLCIRDEVCIRVGIPKGGYMRCACITHRAAAVTISRLTVASAVSASGIEDVLKCKNKVCYF